MKTQGLCKIAHQKLPHQSWEEHKSLINTSSHFVHLVSSHVAMGTSSFLSLTVLVNGDGRLRLLTQKANR